MSDNNTAIWSVIRGGSHLDRVADPQAAGVDIPDDILDWAMEHGLSMDDPGVYLVVVPADEARGGLTGELTWRERAMPAGDLAALRAALEAEDNASRERVLGE